MSKIVLPDWPRDNDGCSFIMYIISMPALDHTEVIQKYLTPIYEEGKQVCLCSRTRSTSLILFDFVS